MTGATTNGATANYAVNGLNQRVRKTGAGGNYSFVYGASGELIGKTSNGGTTLTSQYVWMGNTLIAIIRNNVLYHAYPDILGRPDTVTTTGGSIVWQATNRSFDRSVSINTFGGLNIGFPGQYYDSESGLWYNWNRYYDSGTGKYLQSDPTGVVADLNSYAYAGGNPITRIDPQGLFYFSPPGSNIPDDTSGPVAAPPISECRRACSRSSLGLGALDSSLVVSGQPMIPKRFVTPGSALGTSPASVAASRIFSKRKLPFQVPAPTAANPLARSGSLARITGRYVPIVGYGILAHDLYD